MVIFVTIFICDGKKEMKSKCKEERREEEAKRTWWERVK
jgi:hypothetical protein